MFDELIAALKDYGRAYGDAEAAALLIVIRDGAGRVDIMVGNDFTELDISIDSLMGYLNVDQPSTCVPQKENL
jgi:hypothetical protein